MRSISGPHCIFEPDWLKPGESTHWHAHAVPHHTIALSGDVLVELRSGGHITPHLLKEGAPIRWVLAPAGMEHRVTLMDERSRAVCFFGGRDLLLGKLINGGALAAQIPVGAENIAIRFAGDGAAAVSMFVNGRKVAAADVRGEPGTIEFVGQGYSLGVEHDGSAAALEVVVSGGRWDVYWGAW